MNLEPILLHFLQEFRREVLPVCICKYRINHAVWADAGVPIFAELYCEILYQLRREYLAAVKTATHMRGCLYIFTEYSCMDSLVFR